MKLHVRGGIAALAITGAALIAAGCGGSGGGSGASDAAKDAAALDLAPKSAIGYVTVDTDFSGDQWSQFSDLAKAFDNDFKGVDKEISDATSDSGDDADGGDTEGDDKGKDVDFEKDVDPWLGESGGAAIIKVTKGGDDAEWFAWFELEDVAKFEDFAKDQDGVKQGKKVGDFKTFDSTDEGDDTFIAYNDDYAVLTDSRTKLEKVVKYDGDSIKDADGVSDAIDEVEGDALATVVVNGAGIRQLVKDTPEAKALANADQLKDLHAVAVSFSAEDDGMRVDGHVAADGEKAGKNEESDLFNDLPGNTVFAVGGHDLGGALKTFAEEAGKDNAQIQQGVGAISGVIGVSLDDMAKAFEGDFALALSADDAGLGALAGGVAGAAMGGGLGATDPAALLKAGTVLLAFEETGDAGATLDKIAGAAGGLVGGGTPKTGTSGDFETKSLTLQGIPVTTAASKDVAALAVGLDVFENWGDDSLGESDAFTAAWKAADAPDKALGSIWFDAGRVAKVAGVESGEGVTLGGLVGWVEADDSNANFGLFLHVDED
ncbi:MAG: hypothetical protein JWL76_1187 [Thermoleophilia bacterium]|nr:hypothetical protein [Thermoleophilia bacterium]